MALGFSTFGSTLGLALLALTKTGQSFNTEGLLGLGLRSIAEPVFGIVGSYFLVAALVWCSILVWWEDLPQKVGGILKAPILAFVWLWNKRDKLPKFSFPSHKFSWGTALSKLRTKGQTKAPSQPAMQSSTALLASKDLNALPETEPLVEATLEPAGQKSAAKPDIRINQSVDSQPTKRVRVERPRPNSWDLPPLSLMNYATKKVKRPTREQLAATAQRITSALKSFEIDGEIVEVTPGPIITMYEFQPAPGIRASRILAASTDLAMTLAAPSVRVVAPIPMKSVVGIEVPNIEREDIVLRDCFEQTMDRAKTQRLPMILGKDAEGRPVCEDLARMPHLLVGGATSMGKSVLVNSLLSGLLLRFSPEDLKLIIVDPKLVEFKSFEDIPHLLLPIVNDSADASQALKWAVAETKRRYLLMQKYSAKNIEGYNEKLKVWDAQEGEECPEKIPYIVIIIDELAELMLTSKKDVESSITRLTQLARAAGIHLIMATQRPSADVVTGLIKSNCPSRASLRVASATDSRIILDCQGAEQLLGKGDMFFTNTGPIGVRRMQSAFISDEEIEKICSFWRDQGEPEYRDEILAPESTEENQTEGDDSSLDTLFRDVVTFAKERGKVSTSLIQRRFEIGYTRAARIMEQLESRGIVAEQQAAGKPRDVIL